MIRVEGRIESEEEADPDMSFHQARSQSLEPLVSWYKTFSIQTHWDDVLGWIPEYQWRQVFRFFLGDLAETSQYSLQRTLEKAAQMERQQKHQATRLTTCLQRGGEQDFSSITVKGLVKMFMYLCANIIQPNFTTCSR